MDEKQLDRLLEKYQQGELSEKQRNLVDKWLESLRYKDDIQWSDEYRAQMRQKLVARMALAESPHKVRPLYTRRWVQVAATLLLIVLSYYIASRLLLRQAPALLTVQTTGHVEKVMLNDGSIVWLKEHSQLVYPERFTGDRRDVQLQGEALFEVAKDPAHPFIIACGPLQARVLGTSFNIRTREDNDIEVTVLTGAVGLTSASDSAGIVVQANERALYSEQKPLVKTALEGPREKAGLIARTEYDMNFAAAPVSEIIRRIEAKFNVTVNTDQARLDACRINADLTDLSLEATMRMIAQLTDLQVVIKRSEVIVRGTGNCQ
jgi:ferric-dicitrate binding protein FerR (iron transport regulator)